MGSQKNPPWFGLWSPHVDEPHLTLKVARDLEGSDLWWRQSVAAAATVRESEFWVLILEEGKVEF